MSDFKCFKCGKTDDEHELRKCPMCHKHFCDEHTVRLSGVNFCSRGCAEYFFHGDPDE